MKKDKFVKKIYRENEINRINKKIISLRNYPFNEIGFLNIRLITTLLIFFITLIISKASYITSPIISLVYYYLFEYIFLDLLIIKRTNKLDREALTFFEILTLSLESGRNLEKAIEITVQNVNSELSEEFKKTLFEVRFGKSLIEALEDTKKRIPSETINNIILNITQTNIFGNSIIDTMYSQIEFLREKQVLSIREQINKLPNKISIISVLFIVPIILMIVLGPFLISFMEVNMKKGFTLIELLAVIVILGLLSVITIPKITKTLDESQKKTNLESAKGLVKSAEYKYQENEMNGITENILINYTTGENTSKIEYTGRKPESGQVYIKTNGKIAMAVKIGEECYTKTYNSNDINVEEYDEQTCVFINREIPEIVTSGDGLYETTEPDKYIYRGANPNNYIWLDENKDTIKQESETYRIISYEPDGTIKVIRDTSIGSYAWDEKTDTTTGPRHNTNNTYCNYTGTYYGCNVWGTQESTYYNDTTLTNLNQDFYYKYYPNNTSPLQNYTNTGTVTQNSSLNNYLNNEWTTKQNLDDYISNHSFNVGGIYYTSTYPANQAKTLSQEKEEQNIYTWNGKIGLMNITDYVEASTNPTCTSVYSNFYYNSNYYYDSNGDGTKEQTISGYDNWPCSNRSYNWMAKAIPEWSLSPGLGTRNSVWFVGSSGNLNYYSTYNAYGVRPVFYLKSQIKLGGFGTSDNPYYIID